VKILVCVKRVPDPETVIKLTPEGASIVTDNVKWVINPFDEIAIEEALRIKPDSPEAHNNLAILLQSRRRAKEAIHHYRKP